MDMSVNDVDIKASRAGGDQWLSSWIRVCSLQPLIFQCAQCEQRFYAFAPKMFDDLPTEIAEHVERRHAPGANSLT